MTLHLSLAQNVGASALPWHSAFWALFFPIVVPACTAKLRTGSSLHPLAPPVRGTQPGEVPIASPGILRQPGTRGAVRSMNCCDVLHRWSFLRTRVQFRQEPARGFFPSFNAPSFAAAHDQHSEPKGIPNETKSTA